MYDIYCKLRDSKGYKDATVAKATGITRSTFSDWKYGRSTPKQEKLQKIADFFGVTVGFLMGSENVSSQQASNGSTAQASADSKKNTPEVNIKKLKGLINHNSEVTFKYYSVLCRNERINKDLTERRLSQISNIPLDKYLNFELNQVQLEAEELLQILIALGLDPSTSISYLTGSFAAMAQTVEEREKFVDATFDGDEASKKILLSVLALSGDELAFVIQEMERIVLSKEELLSPKDEKYEQALNDVLVKSSSASFKPKLKSDFEDVPSQLLEKYPDLLKESKKDIS